MVLQAMLLLNLTHVGRAKGYHVIWFSVCMSVCLSVFYQNVWAANNIKTLIELPKGVKLYKDQNKRQAFSKTFWL